MYSILFHYTQNLNPLVASDLSDISSDEWASDISSNEMDVGDDTTSDVIDLGPTG
jgi:hypothetical protein